LRKNEKEGDVKLLSFVAWMHLKSAPQLTTAVLDTETGDTDVSTDRLFNWKNTSQSFIMGEKLSVCESHILGDRLYPLSQKIASVSPQMIVYCDAADTGDFPYPNDSAGIPLSRFESFPLPELCLDFQSKGIGAINVTHARLVEAFGGQLPDFERFWSLSKHLTVENDWEIFAFGLCYSLFSLDARQERERQEAIEKKRAVSERDRDAEKAAQVRLEKISEDQRQQTLSLLNIDRN